MLDFRLRAYAYWQKMVAPTWASVHYTDIDYQNIFIIPHQKRKQIYLV